MISTYSPAQRTLRSASCKLTINSIREAQVVGDLVGAAVVAHILHCSVQAVLSTTLSHTAVTVAACQQK